MSYYERNHKPDVEYLFRHGYGLSFDEARDKAERMLREAGVNEEIIQMELSQENVSYITVVGILRYPEILREYKRKTDLSDRSNAQHYILFVENMIDY